MQHTATIFMLKYVLIHLYLYYFPLDMCATIYCVQMVSRHTDAFQEDGGLSDMQ